jgi:hypothetical protein
MIADTYRIVNSQLDHELGSHSVHDTRTNTNNDSRPCINGCTGARDGRQPGKASIHSVNDIIRVVSMLPVAKTFKTIAQ